MSYAAKAKSGRRISGATTETGSARRAARERYSQASYRRAIVRACDAVDAAARAELRRLGKSADHRIVERWHPHRLRHNLGTRVRKEYGLELARILRGHRSAAVTELYSEVDRSRAREVVARLG